MRTHVEFVSDAFPAEPGEDALVNPGRWGRRLAELLAAELPAFGVPARKPVPEDWGWRIAVESAAFRMTVGCGNRHDVPGGFLCFVEPSRPDLRAAPYRPATAADAVARVADAVDAILGSRPDVRGLRWSGEGER